MYILPSVSHIQTHWPDSCSKGHHHGIVAVHIERPLLLFGFCCCSGATAAASVVISLAAAFVYNL